MRAARHVQLNDPPRCPDCRRCAYYRPTSPRSGYVRCRACGAINECPICPDCSKRRRRILGCGACGSRKAPVYPG